MNKIINSIISLTALLLTVPVRAQDNNIEGLTAKQRAIVDISSLTAIGDLNRLKPALKNGLDTGMSVNEVKEVLIHLYAYCGFPRSLRGIQTFMEVLEERKRRGIKDKPGPTASPVKDSRSKYERGKDNLAKLTGMRQDGPPTGYAAFAPEIEVFLKEHLFADLFDRDVLTYAERELVTVSVNASIGGVDPMVRSHMSHSITSGVTQGQLIQLLDIVELNAGLDKANAARVVLKEVLSSKRLNGDKLIIKPAPSENANVIVPSPIFERGEQTPAQNFTGKAWASKLIPQDATGTYSVGNVVFEPGARTNWHLHPAGQTLLILEGSGWYQEKGKPARAISKGDAVEIPANTEHWHGASKDSSMTHIAITNRKDAGVKWLQPVTDEDYNKVHQQK